ncbi:hypothetical protein HYV57_03270 [Candidatus Peregrinibacteria bacterium]|nr:hypothetical protein [Candidatus Peregrinibacteria bacterium]
MNDIMDDIKKKKKSRESEHFEVTPIEEVSVELSRNGDQKFDLSSQNFQNSHAGEGFDATENSDMAETDATMYEKMPEIGDKVKMHFTNFVQLVATHDFDTVLKTRGEEEIILSADLLADLASCHEDAGPNRLPWVFVVGIVLGVGITYILLKL